MEAGFAALSAKLDHMDEKLNRITILESEILQLREDLSTVIADNARKDAIITKQEERINACEQALRSNSIRIIGLPVTATTTTEEMTNMVYTSILCPILQLAKSNGEIENFPTARFAIDSIFSIPAKKGSTCPVIVRLSSLYLRNTIFRNKKEALPTKPDPQTHTIRPVYQIYEDLTPSNYLRLRAFADHSAVKAAWTYNGQVRFRLKEGEEIYRVKNPSDTVESLSRSTRNRHRNQETLSAEHAAHATAAVHTPS